uniref:Uncharacterized protein n=1 Tax=Anopheles coluzzii TaxID=1518534 RepID=A0A8W7PLS3_ANOCL
MDIQLLNDDHEKAILRDLCKSGGSESTPLTTFSYISEYICSNNIDIWPGEIASSSEASAKQELDHGEQLLKPAAGRIGGSAGVGVEYGLETLGGSFGSGGMLVPYSTSDQPRMTEYPRGNDAFVETGNIRRSVPWGASPQVCTDMNGH